MVENRNTQSLDQARSQGSSPWNQQGFTLPFVLVMIAISLVAVSSVTFLAAHFRSITSAEDGERIYYALDAAVEAVMADLVLGADALDPSYVPLNVSVNALTPSLTVTAPGDVANPTPTFQYFDPGLRHPDLRSMNEGQGYLLHVYDVHPGTFQVNWAFDLVFAEGRDSGPSKGRGQGPKDKDDAEGRGKGPKGKGDSDVKVILKVMHNMENRSSGRVGGCPDGPVLTAKVLEIQSPGLFSLSTGAINIRDTETISIAFCVDALDDVTLVTRPYQPSGFLTDTWVYGIAFKDYKITAAVEGATVTAFVRQMPGPTQPPSGDWSDENISWIKNRVTPYQWQR